MEKMMSFCVVGNEGDEEMMMVRGRGDGRRDGMWMMLMIVDVMMSC